MSSFETQMVSDLAAFGELRAEWDPLVLATARPTPFMLHGWLEPWCALYRPERPIRVVTVRESGRLVGALPVAIKRRGPIRVGELAGGIAFGDALVAGAEPAEVVPLLAAGLRGAPIDAVDFDGLAPQSLLVAHLARAGRVRAAEAIPAPSMAMPDGWDAKYREATSSKTRNTHRRRWKQMEQSGEVAVMRYTTEAEVMPALEDAFRLHALRWAGRRDVSPFRTPEGQAFNRRALAALARDDHVRIIEVRLGGVPISFHIYLLMGTVMFVYRLAFDPAYAHFSPGLLTTLEAIRQASDEGATRVEFLRGDERYKLELADDAGSLTRLIGLPSGPRGHGYMHLTASSTNARSRLRRNERLRTAYRQLRALPHRFRR